MRWHFWGCISRLVRPWILERLRSFSPTCSMVLMSATEVVDAKSTWCDSAVFKTHPPRYSFMCFVRGCSNTCKTWHMCLFGHNLNVFVMSFEHWMKLIYDSRTTSCYVSEWTKKDFNFKFGSINCDPTMSTYKLTPTATYYIFLESNWAIAHKSKITLKLALWKILCWLIQLHPATNRTWVYR